MFICIGFASRLLLEGRTTQKPVSYTFYAAGFACALASLVFVAIERKKNLWQTLIGVTGGALLVTAILINFYTGWFALIGGVLLIAVAIASLFPSVAAYMLESYREMKKQK